jgi:hypothetical protein
MLVGDGAKPEDHLAFAWDRRRRLVVIKAGRVSIIGRGVSFAMVFVPSDTYLMLFIGLHLHPSE